MASKRFDLSTPVVFIIFNRPDTTARVFEAIRQAEPPQLLVIADGPRPDHPGEPEKCAAARSVVDQVDWDCDVLTNFTESNMGCKHRVSSGLDWVFDTVEKAIILEDDCLPHPTFFRFCEELLEKYRDDERVMHVNGTNVQFGCWRGEASYYFSRYPHVWGWATWRRSWQHYDVDMKLWAAAVNKEVYLQTFTSRAEKNFWKEVWDGVCSGKINTWDHQWAFACIARRCFTILPNVNLVSNIGFRADAAHTKEKSVGASLPVEDLEFPLKHPNAFRWDDEADEYTRQLFFTAPSIADRVWSRIGLVFQKALR